MKFDGPKQRDVTQNRNEQINDTSLNIDSDAVDWSDEGEEDDDTPRNHDLLSQLAEESEDDCDQDTLQFSRYKSYYLEIDTYLLVMLMQYIGPFYYLAMISIFIGEQIIRIQAGGQVFHGRAYMNELELILPYHGLKT